MYCIEAIEGVAKTANRGCFWLVGALSVEQEAKAVFHELASNDPARKKLLRAFDYWTQGHDRMKESHHGWDKSEHGGEFVDMHVFKGNKRRLYGIKIHPRPTQPRFVACIVVGSYFCKKKHEAPVETMRRFLRVRDTIDFAQAVKTYFTGHVE